MNQIRIGTSGWTYDHWRGVLYPPGVPPRRWLERYAQEFDTVEVNATFYRLLPESTFKGWHHRVQRGFVFALKASRQITHLNKLEGSEDELRHFLSHAELLQDRLGPLLFQLPPHWSVDVERFRSFLKLVPKKHRCAFEFRDSSWLCDPIYKLLHRHNAALVRVSAPEFPDADVVTADFCYVRMHGDQVTYSSQYSDNTLRKWADAMIGWACTGHDVYVYFNNDVHGYAVEDARALRRIVAQQC